MVNLLKHKNKTIVLYLAGLAILGFLIYRMDVGTIGEALSSVRTNIFFVFLAVIPGMFMDTMSIYNLTHFKVSFFHTLLERASGSLFLSERLSLTLGHVLLYLPLIGST